MDITNYITVPCKIKFKNIQQREVFNTYWKAYNSIRNFMYCRMFDNYCKNIPYSKTTIIKQAKDINIIPLTSGFYSSAYEDANLLLTNTINNYKKKIQKVQTYSKCTSNNNKQFKLPKIKACCFGGKKIYKDYQKGLITKEELINKRKSPLYIIGEAPQKCNRNFRLLSLNTCRFQPNKNTIIDIDIVIRQNYKKDFEKLIWLQSLYQKDNKAIPITFKMTDTTLYVIYDLSKVRNIPDYQSIKNRIFSFDSNPNHLGCTIIDWKGELDYNIISAFDISLEELNKYDNDLKGHSYSSTSKQRKYISNKRNFEIEQIAKFLVSKAKHYKCEIFAVENLEIENINKTTHYQNKLCNNQWLYAKLVKLIEKQCKLQGIKFQKIISEYTSFLGNIVFQKENLPDYCLASIEISRRCYEFYNQFIKQTKLKNKNIIFPKLDLVRRRISDALEVIGYNDDWTTLRDLYYKIKKAKLNYRFPLNSCKYSVFRLFSQTSYTKLYNFR